MWRVFVLLVIVGFEFAATSSLPVVPPLPTPNPTPSVDPPPSPILFICSFSPAFPLESRSPPHRSCHENASDTRTPQSTASTPAAQTDAPRHDRMFQWTSPVCLCKVCVRKYDEEWLIEPSQAIIQLRPSIVPERQARKSSWSPMGYHTGTGTCGSWGGRRTSTVMLYSSYLCIICNNGHGDFFIQKSNLNSLKENQNVTTRTPRTGGLKI